MIIENYEDIKKFILENYLTKGRDRITMAVRIVKFNDEERIVFDSFNSNSFCICIKQDGSFTFEELVG